MAEEFTLEILHKAMEQIERCEADHEIIGFRLHPSDLWGIRTGAQWLFCTDNKKMTITPPYQGLRLVSDADIPPGYPQPIRSK
jgi:hypothetical protein